MRKNSTKGSARPNATWAVAVVSLLGAAAATPASAATLFSEDFSDTTLEPGAQTQNATIAGGIATFADASTSTRNRFVVVQNFTSPVMTFSFDSVAPVTAAAGVADNELVLRAGNGSANQSLGSSEFNTEAIAWRSSGSGTAGGPRGSFPANGLATVFTVVNNQDATLVFPSPIDGTDVTLAPFQYIDYTRDNNPGGVYAVLKGVTNMVDLDGATPGPGTISRFSIGSSSSGHQGTMAIDNVLVVDQVSLPGGVTPEPATLGLAAMAGLGLLARDRRRA